MTGKEIIAALKKAGFIVVRESGSHKFLSHPDDATRHATVAVHSSKYVPVGTLSNILRTARVAPEELRKLL